ncbi:MAG: polysaccharide biosynthesis tyrosine autokinase [Acidobacteria bacterium]|nr:polysaccharide biosynthesis tyrosine autokinase [Acidobacteriota bacterium]MBV9071340.1 polysaccharide biosynthesis tyrosine autokinase [Acidobacteriota bacterium]MBV9476472.1 polysaccharide biosynthesis tyrosine autokinase [Acidobacteriota bacterium]
MDLNTSTQEVHLSHYWNIIRKRWSVATAILVVVMLGTFLASYFSQPLYRSTIQLQIERENQSMTIDDLFGIPSSDQEFLQTQYVLLRTRGLAERVIADHNLLSDPEFYPPGIAGRTPAEIHRITESMAGGLLGGISVDPVRATSLVEISYVGTSPRLAQKIAEGWGESFKQLNVEQKLESVQQASEFLTRQISTVKTDLDRKRQELQAYGENKGIVPVGSDGSNVMVQKLTQLNADVIDAQNLRFEKQAALESTTRTAPEALATGDPLVSRLTDELSRQEREYSEKRTSYLEAHPIMVALRDQIEKTRAARATAVRQAYEKAVESARAVYSAAQAREASVRNAYAEQQHEAEKQNVDAAHWVDLRMQVETKQALLSALEKQLSETQVLARIHGTTSSNIRWVDHAQLPGARFNLSMKKNLQSAFPLGVILGLAAIFFLEYMDRSIKTPEELERMTRFASLGVIPAAGTINNQRGYGYTYGRGPAKLRPVETPADQPPTAGVELIPHTDTRSPVSEAYRAFRTSLLLASASSPKVIVITSSFAREGKTTTSVNLATVLAQMGKPVLLVDADLRRPRLQKVFPGKLNLGLVNYLAASIPLEDIVQPTEVPNLSIVLSGPIPPNPSELLASDRMKHLIEDVRSKFAYVIFDSPPVLAVTDAIVLAASADGVVLTVHGGQTPRELVQRSAERLRQSNIPVLGALLNNLDLHQYGYTYRKSYYSYYADSEEETGGARERQAR